MATSETEIVNLALVRIGHKQTITSLGEGTPTADVCKVLYEPTRDTVLQAHPWNFAIRRATLSRSASEPEFEFQYKFALPSGPTPPYCLKVVRTSWEAIPASGTWVYSEPFVHGYTSLTPYRIEGRWLLANEESCAIEYIARITDVTQYSVSFVNALSLKLSAELAMPLADNQQLARTMAELYEAAVRDARVTDAQEGTPREVLDASAWVMSRV